MILRVPLEGLTAGRRQLSVEASRYLFRVHRLVVGARFVAFDPAARLEAEAEIVTVGRSGSAELGPPRPATRVATREVQVIQALPKGTKIDAILRDATELGATRVTIVTAARSVKQKVDLERLRRIAVEATRQCGRGDLPAIDAASELEVALSGCTATHRICLHEAGEATLAATAGAGGVAALIGPEGGFTSEELALARAAGFSIVRLGPFTMRTETACAAALGALAALAPCRG